MLQITIDEGVWIVSFQINNSICLVFSYLVTANGQAWRHSRRHRSLAAYTATVRVALEIVLMTYIRIPRNM